MLLNSKDTDNMFWHKCHLSLQKQNVKAGPNSEIQSYFTGLSFPEEIEEKTINKAPKSILMQKKLRV